MPETSYERLSRPSVDAVVWGDVLQNKVSRRRHISSFVQMLFGLVGLLVLSSLIVSSLYASSPVKSDATAYLTAMENDDSIFWGNLPSAVPAREEIAERGARWGSSHRQDRTYHKLATGSVNLAARGDDYSPFQKKPKETLPELRIVVDEPLSAENGRVRVIAIIEGVGDGPVRATVDDVLVRVRSGGLVNEEIAVPAGQNSIMMKVSDDQGRNTQKAIAIAGLTQRTLRPRAAPVLSSAPRSIQPGACAAIEGAGSASWSQPSRSSVGPELPVQLQTEAGLVYDPTAKFLLYPSYGDCKAGASSERWGLFHPDEAQHLKTDQCAVAKVQKGSKDLTRCIWPERQGETWVYKLHLHQFSNQRYVVLVSNSQAFRNSVGEAIQLAIISWLRDLQSQGAELPVSLLSVDSDGIIETTIRAEDLENLRGDGGGAIRERVKSGLRFDGVGLRPLEHLRDLDDQFGENISRVLFLTDASLPPENLIQGSDLGATLNWQLNGIEFQVMTTDHCEFWRDRALAVNCNLIGDSSAEIIKSMLEDFTGS